MYVYVLCMCCRGVGRRRSLDPMLLWLWHRPAATALIQPLTWELPCAAGVALKRKKKKLKIKNNKIKIKLTSREELMSILSKINGGIISSIASYFFSHIFGPLLKTSIITYNGVLIENQQMRGKKCHKHQYEVENLPACSAQ